MKLIVMSATLDAAKFAHFFDGAKVIYLQVRGMPERFLLTRFFSEQCRRGRRWSHDGKWIRKESAAQGRQFPVETLYVPEPVDSYLDAVLRAVLQIHVDEPRGDILAFLTGQDEIETLQRLIPERYITTSAQKCRCWVRSWFHLPRMMPHFARRILDNITPLRVQQLEGGEAHGRLLVVPIYAALPPEQQVKVFEPTPPGTRKVSPSVQMCAHSD